MPGRAAAKRAREDDDQMSTAIKNSVEDEGPSSFHPEHMELAMAADEATTAQAAHSRYCFICMEEPLTANVGGLATVSHVDRDYLMTCAHKVCSNCAPGYLHDAEKKEGERGFDVAPKQCVTVLEPPNRAPVRVANVHRGRCTGVPRVARSTTASSTRRQMATPKCCAWWPERRGRRSEQHKQRRARSTP